MDLSFHEKSAAISLLAILGTYGYYFYFVFLGLGPSSTPEMLGWMIALVVVLVVVEVLFHIAIAVFNPAEANARTDEREKLILLKSHRVGYLILAAGVMLTLGRILFGSVFAPEEVTLLGIANLLLFSFVAAELGHYGAQLYHYRRGV